MRKRGIIDFALTLINESSTIEGISAAYLLFCLLLRSIRIYRSMDFVR
jgi:hypothetical protein